jgi:ferric-chelate reductase
LLCALSRLIRLHRTSHTSTQDGETAKTQPQSFLYRFQQSLKSVYHRHLLRGWLRGVFGHTTGFNILVLLILTAYLTVFSFVGIVYKTWYSPVAGSPNLKQTRVGLGPWADRIGVLAYALTPLAVLLSTRESLLSLITGIPHHHFLFLHRWLGYIIYAQSFLHTIGWTIIEAKLYQPQPSTWNEFIAQEYMIWGVVAMIFLSFLVFCSAKWCIRLTGYEFFRKSHYVVAMLYVGACWGHWAMLSCWMIASLTVWFLDRGVRLLRTAILHTTAASSSNSPGRRMHIPTAQMTSFAHASDGDVIRLDFTLSHRPWAIGQHFYLCFPDLSIWQSHPMTPSSVPTSQQAQTHTYIIRAKSGITRQLAQLARFDQESTSTSVVLAGPYGQSILTHELMHDDVNILCIAGGTGVTFVLPVLLHLIRQPSFSSRSGLLEFIWVIRRKADMAWLKAEMDELVAAAEGCPNSNFRVRVFVTREADADAEALNKDDVDVDGKEVVKEGILRTSSTSTTSAEAEGAFSVQYLGSGSGSADADRHPDVGSQVTDFVSRVVHGPTRVVASGPTGLISDLRRGVAACNDPARVWRGEERCDVQLVHDDRLEW